MVRNYKKKKEDNINEGDVEKAILKVVNGDLKLRKAAEIYNIKTSTLFYRIKNYKENKISKSKNYSSKYTVSQVFTNDEEKMLETYLLKMSKMNYGLTYKQARALAFQYATALNKCPDKWRAIKEAGIDWIKGFMKRHKNLSLRKPENTSLSRSTSFNKHNVSVFYDNYERVLQRGFSPDRIYNLDETNITTVVQAPNVIAMTGQKQVGQCVSAERGQLITMCAIVNTIGNTIPPVFIFPRARFHESMLIGAPLGSIGFANNPKSGWMTGTLFVKVLEHIQRTTRCNKNDKILLLLDNHESHCTIEAINFCRDNGIVLLTFPPHCTHKMQPLDVAVNSPFKQKLAVAQNDWLLNHPGKTITIHDLAGIVTPAYTATHTPRNITSGFSKPGIFPLSRNAFTDEDFECAEVTNRLQPKEPIACAEETNRVQTEKPSEIEADRAVLGESPFLLNPIEGLLEQHAEQIGTNTITSSDRKSPVTDSSLVQDVRTDHVTITHSNNESLITNEVGLLSPEIIKPFPKAPPRKETRKGRKKGNSRILTDTPEKIKIEAASLERKRRLEKYSLNKKRKPATKDKSIKKQKRITNKQKSFRYDSSSNSELEDDDSDMEETDTSDNIDELEDKILQDPESVSICIDNLNIGDFILVRYQSARQPRYLAYVGKIEEKSCNSFTVSFLKRKGGVFKFFFPENDEKCVVNKKDVLAKLPVPTGAGSTTRTASMLYFKFNFSKYNLG